MKSSEIDAKHNELLKDELTEIQGGVWIQSKEGIQADQASWDEEDKSKGMDFSGSPYWLTTGTGNATAIDEDLSDRDRFQTYLESEGFVEKDEQQQAQQQTSAQSRSADHFKVLQDLTDARQDRDKWRMEYQPPASEGERKEWQERYNAMEAKVDERQEAFADTVKSSTPEQLGSFRDLIAQRRQNLVESIEKEQGAAFVPAEATQANEQAQEQGGSFRDRLNQRRQQQEQGETETQGGGSGRGRMEPRWAAYATTTQEYAEGRELEETQNMLTQRYGRRPTDKEVQAYEAERAAGQSGDNGQPKQDKGLERRDDYGLGM